MSEIIHFDEQAFLFFNNLGSSSWDNLWVLITGKLTWVPLYALLAYLLYRQLGIRRLGVVIVCIVLMITVTDQFTNLMKHSFERFRPCHNAELAGLFRPVDCEGRGRFGFTSAHASNSMALALFVGYLLKPSYKWIRPLLVFWAILVGYSRIYVGVHYTGDVVCGFIIGSIIAFLFVKVYKNLIQKLDGMESTYHKKTS